jgi:hypothetical protein
MIMEFKIIRSVWAMASLEDPDGRPECPVPIRQDARRATYPGDDPGRLLALRVWHGDIMGYRWEGVP